MYIDVAQFPVLYELFKFIFAFNVNRNEVTLTAQLLH